MFYMFIDEEYPVLDAPLSEQEMEQKHDNGYLEAVVKVDLYELMQWDIEGSLDMLSESLTGYESLMGITSEVVGVASNGDILIKVQGDVSSILDLHEDEDEDEDDDDCDD